MKALPWGLFMTPNRYLPLEVPEGPAAATSIQNNSGPPQGPADLRRQASDASNRLRLAVPT